MILNYVRNEVLETPSILTFHFHGSLHNNKHSTFEKLDKIGEKFRSELISYTQGVYEMYEKFSVRNFLGLQYFLHRTLIKRVETFLFWIHIPKWNLNIFMQ